MDRNSISKYISTINIAVKLPSHLIHIKIRIHRNHSLKVRYNFIDPNANTMTMRQPTKSPNIIAVRVGKRDCGSRWPKANEFKRIAEGVVTATVKEMYDNCNWRRLLRLGPIFMVISARYNVKSGTKPQMRLFKMTS